MPEIIPNLHPVFVHFTVALFSIATALFAVLFFVPKIQPGLLPERLKEQLLIVARWNLWIGAAITLITVAAGFFAFNSVTHDAPSHAAMKLHRNWALTTLPFYLAAAIWSMYSAYAGKQLNRFFIGAVLATQLLLLSTAWHGGELVYRYGLGVISLPQPEGDVHAHGGGQSTAHAPDMDMGDMEMDSTSTGTGDGDSDHAH